MFRGHGKYPRKTFQHKFGLGSLGNALMLQRYNDVGKKRWGDQRLNSRKGKKVEGPRDDREQSTWGEEERFGDREIHGSQMVKGLRA